MYSQPGKKLLFMGGDIGQQIEWNHDQGLDWHLLDFKSHHGINHYMRDLLQLYRRNPSMYELDCDSEGFEWIDFHDAENTIISYQRKTKNPADTLYLYSILRPLIEKITELEFLFLVDMKKSSIQTPSSTVAQMSEILA